MNKRYPNRLRTVHTEPPMLRVNRLPYRLHYSLPARNFKRFHWIQWSSNNPAVRWAQIENSLELFAEYGRLFMLSWWNSACMRWKLIEFSDASWRWGSWSWWHAIVINCAANSMKPLLCKAFTSIALFDRRKLWKRKKFTFQSEAASSKLSSLKSIIKSWKC